MTSKPMNSSEQMVESIDYLRHLESVSNDWFTSLDNISNDVLNSKFNDLFETIKENNDLFKDIENQSERQLKDIILNSNLNIDNKETNDLSENDLMIESNRLKSCVQSLGSELMAKRQEKSELTAKTNALYKQLEEMNGKVKELKQQKDSNDSSDEYLTLAGVMRVMYKTYNNSKVIGLLFNDNEEKSLERLIVIDRENRSEEQMSQQFWDSLNNDYKTGN